MVETVAAFPLLAVGLRTRALPFALAFGPQWGYGAVRSLEIAAALAITAIGGWQMTGWAIWDTLRPPRASNVRPIPKTLSASTTRVRISSSLTFSSASPRWPSSHSKTFPERSSSQTSGREIFDSTPRRARHGPPRLPDRARQSVWEPARRQ